MAAMAAAPGGWLADAELTAAELAPAGVAPADLAPADVAPADVTGEDAAAFTALAPPGWGFALPARKATVPTAASTTTAATAISQTRRPERLRPGPAGGPPW